MCIRDRNKANQILPLTIFSRMFWRPSSVVLGVVFNTEYDEKVQVSRKGWAGAHQSTKYEFDGIIFLQTCSQQYLCFHDDVKSCLKIFTFWLFWASLKNLVCRFWSTFVKSQEKYIFLFPWQFWTIVRYIFLSQGMWQKNGFWRWVWIGIWVCLFSKMLILGRYQTLK